MRKLRPREGRWLITTMANIFVILYIVFKGFQGLSIDFKTN